jgi:uncharacterized protein (TIGR03067 family)
MRQILALSTLPLFLAGIGCSRPPAGNAPDNAAANTQPADPTEQDMKTLQGKWKFVSMEQDGRQAPPERFKDMVVQFEGSKMVEIRRGARRGELDFKVHAQHDPKRIELIREARESKMTSTATGQPVIVKKEREVSYGIYRLEGDKLTLCMGEKTKDYPKAFATEKGSSLTLATLQRSTSSPEQEHEEELIRNLQQIALAFHIYHDGLLVFPATREDGSQDRFAGNWRLTLLPMIEQNALYNAYDNDQPWDGPHNKKLLAAMPDIYRDPRFQKKEDKPTTTYFRGFSGEGTIFGNPKGVSLGEITKANGLANTILIVEAGDAVPWLKPGELAYDPKKPVPPLGGPAHGDFYAVFCDGHVRRIPAKTDEQTLRSMIQWTNKKPFVLPGKEVAPPLKLR